jgi:hypothetical protein
MNQPKQIQDKIVVINKNISWALPEDLKSRYLIKCFYWSVQSVNFGAFNFSEGNVPAVYCKWLLTSIKSKKFQFQLQILFSITCENTKLLYKSTLARLLNSAIKVYCFQGTKKRASELRHRYISHLRKCALYLSPATQILWYSPLVSVNSLPANGWQ